MTTDTQPLAPTDADIDALWVGQQLTVPQLVQRRVIARAALAKWGALPAVAGEPVMWAYQYSDGSWHDASATEHSAGMKPLYPAPHPTQAQAGAVPQRWKAVPVNPTPEMLSVMWVPANSSLADAYSSLSDAYNAMLAAAPQPVECEPLIRQLVAALEGYRRNHNDTQPCDAEREGRAWLEGKP